MNIPIWFSNLLFWSAQIAVFAVAAALLTRVLRLRQPRVLLVFWRCLVALSFLLPFLQPWHRPPSGPTVVISTDLPVSILSPPSTPPAPHWHLPSMEFMAQIIGVLVLIGIAVRFVLLGLGLLKLRRLRRSASSIAATSESWLLLETTSAQLNARAEFRLSVDVDSPVTFGFASPVILLPERFPTLGVHSQSAIACHELLHVRRHDWAHHLAEELLRATFWFHPAVAWLISRVRLAREQVVDLEVVNLTQARKPYLEALLEFTNARSLLAAVPAPPFLAERQLAERISLMLKEVRMSRARLIASITVISCSLALTIALAAWVFPLKAAPRFPQNPPQGGVTGGVSGGVQGGMSEGASSPVPAKGASGGTSGGITGGIGGTTSQSVPDVDLSAIWTDTVKRGPMLRQYRGLGTLIQAENSVDFIARAKFPKEMVKEIQPNQAASVDTRNGIVKGHVISVAMEIANGMGSVDIALDDSRNAGFTVGHEIDCTVDIEKLDDILQVGRPATVPAHSSASVFKIVNGGKEAQRVGVKFGRTSVNTIEVLDGLKEGDKIILSDMSAYDNAYRLRLTDQMHPENH